MKVVSIECLHLELPFRNTFEHALKSRSSGETLLLRVATDGGYDGWGETLPREYVTGETIEHLLGDGSRSTPLGDLAHSVIGTRIDTPDALIDWSTAALAATPEYPALIGGIELALWSALCQSQPVDFAHVLGPRRQHDSGRCVTIGFDAATSDLRARAIDARLKRATVVKLKIGLEDDVERIAALNKAFKGRVPIRLDANGQYNPDRLDAMLAGCRGSNLQSVEQPLPRSERNATALKPLFTTHGIPFIADESVCTEADAHRLVEQGTYQGFNLRVGKHGGLAASGRIRDLALSSGLSLVAGSMVGETGILTQASELLLEHSDCLDYVEGLGQNRQFLLHDPVERTDEQPVDGARISMRPFRFRKEVGGSAIIGRYHYGN